MPRFTIRHVTRYSYEDTVRDSANQVMLFPITDEFQELVKQELLITGDPPVEIYTDYYGNSIGAFTCAEPHRQLVVDSKVEVVVHPRNAPEDSMDPAGQWSELSVLKNTQPFIDFIKVEAAKSLDEIRSLDLLQQAHSKTPLQAALQISDYIFQHFAYDNAVTDVETTIDEVWTLKAGVCQDFAHLCLVMLRMIGIPARYISGYICPNKNGMRGEGATHAWVEAFLPGNGWLGLDPTNNCIVNDLHVRLATGRSFTDVSPVRGTYKGSAKHTLEVGVTIGYEDGSRSEDQPAVLVPQPAKTVVTDDSNSYRRHMEMMQQQQQQ